MKALWRVIGGLLFFWLLVLLYMSTTLYQSGDLNERTERQLSKALHELDGLKRQNQDLQSLANELRDIRLVAERGGLTKDEQRKAIESLSSKIPPANAQGVEHMQQGAVKCPVSGGLSEPDLTHELMWRKVDDGIKELGFYLSSQLSRLRDLLPASNKEAQDRLDGILENARDHQRVIRSDIFNLSLSSGLEQWRAQEADELSEIVQNRIHFLQNPADCSKAKKLVCHINKGCGYGCQLHHLVYCFNIAYGLGRTFVLESRGWRYSTGGWEKVFLPLSQTCTDREGKDRRGWGPSSSISSVQVIDLPIVDSLHPRPAFMPLSIPEDLAPRLTRLHGNPAVWWLGQILKYALKPQQELAEDMEITKQALGFKNPIVGVHVRRTDKVGTEAAFHGIEEYMREVEEYYKLLEKRQEVDQRRVYLATDDPQLLKEAKEKFPSYTFISDNGFSQSAGLGTRYSDSSLRGVVLDIHFLSLTDFLVCTFSSQVCRVAYEIMQGLHPDASARYRSLDDIFYFGGQNAHEVVAIYPHTPENSLEIELQAGDILGIAGNHWDGFSKGQNRRTGKTGLFPSYKTVNKVDSAPYETYPQADKLRRS